MEADLKRQQTSGAGLLTKRRNLLVHLIVEDDREKVERNFELLRQDFENYQDVHTTLCDLLDHDDQIDHEIGWYRRHEEDYINIVARVQEFLREKKLVFPPPPALSPLLASTPLASSLPASSPPGFSAPPVYSAPPALSTPLALSSTLASSLPAPSQYGAASRLAAPMPPPSYAWNPVAEPYVPANDFNSVQYTTPVSTTCVPAHAACSYTDPLLTALSLPKPELETFSGDVSSYRLFITSFDSRIGNRDLSDPDKLYYLNQYMRGEPQELIHGCFYGLNGYNEARRLLEAEYGHPYKLSVYFVKKIQEWPSIKADDCKTLKQFAHFLTKCQQALNGVHYGHTLDHPSTLVDAANKLPPYLRNKWREQAHRISQLAHARFSDLTHFVTHAAAVANDPVFGKQSADLPKVSHAKVGHVVVDGPQKSAVKPKGGQPKVGQFFKDMPPLQGKA